MQGNLGTFSPFNFNKNISVKSLTFIVYTIFLSMGDYSRGWPGRPWCSLSPVSVGSGTPVGGGTAPGRPRGCSA